MTRALTREAAAARPARGCTSIDITAQHFRDHIDDVHLSPRFSGRRARARSRSSWCRQLAARHLKVVLGGQGGDEIFGGYARYLLAYFEQCIKAALDGTYKNGNFVVTIESIVPNLGLLREYKPMMREFWRDGLFGRSRRALFPADRPLDRHGDEVDWRLLDKQRVFESFRAIFNNQDNVQKEAYFDKMTHFDFKCLLPALLQVEDRMSMAHGLESRVPLLDHPLIEFLATVPADVKFEGGRMKHLLKRAYGRRAAAERSSIAATRWASRCRSRNGFRASCAISCRISSAAAAPASARSSTPMRCSRISKAPASFRARSGVC